MKPFQETSVRDLPIVVNTLSMHDVQSSMRRSGHIHVFQCNRACFILRHVELVDLEVHRFISGVSLVELRVYIRFLTHSNHALLVPRSGHAAPTTFLFFCVLFSFFLFFLPAVSCAFFLAAVGNVLSFLLLIQFASSDSRPQ